MFDPFGDFENAGYLRNRGGLKDLGEVADTEHQFFLENIKKAAKFLSGRRPIEYTDFLAVHRILFGEFYPWAGQDRLNLGVATYISKGGQVQFESAEMVRAAIEWGLGMGNDPERIARTPGEVMGVFAWGHPFLDGNGRTMTVVHAELLHRAGLAINWAGTAKNSYLDALTLELKQPRHGHLDRYLIPHLVETDKSRPWIQQLSALAALNGKDAPDESMIAYKEGDAVGRAGYESMVKERSAALNEK